MADTCPLAKLPDYASFGTSSNFPGPWVGACGDNIILTGGGKAEVIFRVDNPRPVAGPVEQLGDFKIISEPQPEPTQCYRYVVLPDQNMLVVWAFTMDDAMNPCVLSDIGVNAAIQHLRTVGSIPVLPNPVDANSLRRVNACQLLTAADLAEVPRLDASQVYPRYFNWDCVWGTDRKTDYSAPWVETQFDSRDPLTSEENGPLQTIAGRSVFVQSTTDSTHNYCTAHVVHTNTPQPTGAAIEESVSIVVHANVPSDQQCQLAVKLATKVIPHLPPTN